MPDIIKKKAFFIIFLVSATIFVASLYKRVITFDDAFFAEQAFWVTKTGYSRSELFNSVLDWGDRQYVYHKLHVWQNALITQYFGWSAYFFKAAPILYLLVFIFSAHFYYKRYLLSENPESFYLFLSLLLINTYIVHFGFESRPEIMMMCVGFLSFLFIRYGLQIERKSYLFLSGLLAGTAALFHLNGLIYIAAGVGLIIYMRQYRYLPIFILSASIIAALYWYEMIFNNAIATGISQLVNDPAVSSDGLSTKNFILKIFFTPRWFASHLFDFSYLLLLVLSLYLYRHTLKNNYEVKLLLVYFIVSEVTLAIISPGGKTMYLVLHMPFVLLIVSSLHNTIASKSIKRTMLVAFSFYAITQVGHVIGLIKQSNSEIIQQHAQVVEKYQIGKSDKIIAPTVFIFNEIGNARITSNRMFRLLARNGNFIFNSENIFNYAQQHDYKYLILETDFLPEFSSADLSPDRLYFGYRLIGADFGYYIFRSAT